VAWHVPGRTARQVISPVGRVVALVLLAILSLFVWGFVGRLTTDLRRYLVRELLGRRLRLAVGLDVLAAGCLIAGLAAPSPLRPGLTIAAPVAALVARLLLGREAATAAPAAPPWPAGLTGLAG
jgi:hypothetical protein